ncbi:hypothetical protein CerSpe_059030 [Prunus speciosa]
MDILFAHIQADVHSNDAFRQSNTFLQALQQSVVSRDISVITKFIVEEIIASLAFALPASPPTSKTQSASEFSPISTSPTMRSRPPKSPS